MNITSEPTRLSLAQRIAKVRNCMLVEISTGISVTDKDLFVSLCQTYEQQNVVSSCLPGEPHESLPHSISPTSNLTQETAQSSWLFSRNIPLWEQGVGFLVTNRADFDWLDGFSDWDKYGS